MRICIVATFVLAMFCISPVAWAAADDGAAPAAAAADQAVVAFKLTGWHGSGGTKPDEREEWRQVVDGLKRLAVRYLQI